VPASNKPSDFNDCQINSSDINRSELSNGAVFVSKKLSHFSGAGLAITLLGGSREEKLEEIGLTHLLEHLVFKRTSKLTPSEIARRIDSFGGDINAYTDTEEISLYGEVPLSSLKDLLSLFAELLSDCKFSDEDFQIEKDVIKQEISDAKDDPESVVFQRFSELFWPDSSFGLPVFGYEKSVLDLSRKSVENRLAEIFVGKRLVISAVGDLDHEDFLKEIEKHFASLPSGTAPTRETLKIGQAFEQLSSDTEQVYLTLGIPCPNLRAEEVYVAELLSSSFGELMSSRLFQELREKRGLAYEISSTVESYPDTGSLLIQASFEKGRALDALEVISGEFKKISSSPFTEKELSLAQAHALARLSVENDSLSANLWRLHEGETVHKRFITIAEDKNFISRTTTDDVSSYVEKWLHQVSPVVVLGGDVEVVNLEEFFKN